LYTLEKVGEQRRKNGEKSREEGREKGRIPKQLLGSPGAGWYPLLQVQEYPGTELAQKWAQGANSAHSSISE
jgi:hypothetical protein